MQLPACARQARQPLQPPSMSECTESLLVKEPACVRAGDGAARAARGGRPQQARPGARARQRAARRRGTLRAGGPDRGGPVGGPRAARGLRRARTGGDGQPEADQLRALLCHYAVRPVHMFGFVTQSNSPPKTLITETCKAHSACPL